MGNYLGLSGDEIVITGNEVVKTCRTNQDRFRRNAAKQAAFSSPFISAVPIIEEGLTNSCQWIKMPFLDCDNAMVWLSKANETAVATFTQRLTDYLSASIKVSQVAPFDYSAWQTKIDELLTKIIDPIITNTLHSLRSHRFTHDLYYGSYHGDLTLANLLISDDLTINAIDFLDCFIHSPIWDAVKLRQDTRHFWTLHLLGEHSFDTDKATIALGYIDQAIEQIIIADPILNEYYLPFQVLSLIRILPYCKDDTLVAYLQAEVARLHPRC